MNRSHYKTVLAAGLFLFFASCKVLKEQNQPPFILSDAFYYSWIEDENSHGTHIEVILKEVERGVTFDSLIFRSIRMPVDVTKKEGATILKSNLFGGIPELEREQERVEKTDRLIYRAGGEKREYPLKTIRRKEMRYY